MSSVNIPERSWKQTVCAERSCLCFRVRSRQTGIKQETNVSLLHGSMTPLPLQSSGESFQFNTEEKSFQEKRRWLRRSAASITSTSGAALEAREPPTCRYTTIGIQNAVLTHRHAVPAALNPDTKARMKNRCPRLPRLHLLPPTTTTGAAAESHSTLSEHPDRRKTVEKISDVFCHFIWH